MKKLLAFLGIFLVVGGGYWFFLRDPGHIPMLDRNRIVLADTEAQGYCSGEVFWNSPDRSQPQIELMNECLKKTTLSTDINLSAVQLAFCQGAKAAGFSGDINVDCMQVLQYFRLWPTRDARLTDAWDASKGYPYPGDTFSSGGSGPGRADTRESGERPVAEDGLR